VILTKGEHSRPELLAALEAVTLDGTNSAKSALTEVLFSRPLELTSLAMGNIGENQAQAAVNTILKGVAAAASGAATADTGGEVEVMPRIVNPGRPIEIRSADPRPNDNDHVAVVTLVRGVSTVEDRVIWGILDQILDNVASSTLRTKMQFGYYVHAGISQLANVQLLNCVVQGTDASADTYEAAIQMVLLKTMFERLQDLTSEELQNIKNSFVASLSQEPFHTGEEIGHFWRPIVSTSDCFSLHQAMLDYLNKPLDWKAVLMDAWKQTVMPYTTNRGEEAIRKLVVVKYFPGKKPPPRPSVDQRVEVWKKYKLPDEAIGMLKREWDGALQLDKADSTNRAEVLKAGSYFPTDQHCGPRSSPKDDAPSSLLAASQEEAGAIAAHRMRVSQRGELRGTFLGPS
jgi:hypothetical protein